MQAMRRVGNVLIVIGLLLLYFVVYEVFGTSLETRRHQSSLRAEFADILDDPRTVPTVSPSPEPSAIRRSPQRPPVIAQLIIPKLGVDVIVIEGVRIADLAWGPGRYPDSDAIGAKGSTAIAGHRTGWGSPFYNLDHLVGGDEVIIRTARATYHYRVTKGNVVVGPDDYWVTDGDPASRAPSKLALTTCTPRFTSKQRLIVWADLVSTETNRV